MSEPGPEWLRSMARLLGRESASVDSGGWLVVNGARYPVVDDVVVLLEPAQYTAVLRRRLRLAGEDESRSNDIQYTFGEEWKEFSRALPEYEQEFERYFDLIDLGALKEKTVCDLGCGMGRWSYFMAPLCRELVLVDFSDAIFVARDNLRSASNILFFMGDIQKLPFRDGFADLIFSLGVLHHLPSDALEELRRLRRFAPEILAYLYYSLDNRPAFFRILLSVVTIVRRGLSKVRNRTARTVITRLIAAFVYLPLVGLGWSLAPFGLSRKIPLFEIYHSRSWKGICQDAYDRFFTRIEQRFSRAEVETLRDEFRVVRVSENLPYWHFLCQR